MAFYRLQSIAIDPGIDGQSEREGNGGGFAEQAAGKSGNWREWPSEQECVDHCGRQAVDTQIEQLIAEWIVAAKREICRVGD